MKVTIGIPVYNMKEHLRECLDSVLMQSYSNLEILCVDNNSTDGSASILADYRHKDPRVRVIPCKEQGLQFVRQTIIKEARGTYLIYVDSDDVVEKDYILNLYNIMQQHDVNVAVSMQRQFKPPYDRTTCSDDQAENYWSLWCKGLLFQQFNKLLSKDDILDNLNYFPWGPMSKMYKLSDMIKYQININKKVSLGEDLLFWLEYLLIVPEVKVYLINNIDYLYRQGVANALTSTSVKEEDTLLMYSLYKICLKYKETNISFLYKLIRLWNVESFDKFINMYKNSNRIKRYISLTMRISRKYKAIKLIKDSRKTLVDTSSEN